MQTAGRRSELPLSVISVILMIGGCVTTPDVLMTSATAEGGHATQMIQEREQELSAFRADMAATRIAAAKQEAELQELRATVVQLRQENRGSYQDLLEAKRILERREAEGAAMKAERDRLAQASVQTGINDRQLAALQDMVATLSRELGEVKATMALATYKSDDSREPPHSERDVKAQAGGPSEHQSASFSVSPRDATERMIPAVHVVLEEADQSKPSWITVQPGQSWWSLARQYHTTMRELRAANGRIGDHLIAGEAIRLP